MRVLGHPDALTSVDQRRGFHMDCLPRTLRVILRRCKPPLHPMCSGCGGLSHFPHGCSVTNPMCVNQASHGSLQIRYEVAQIRSYFLPASSTLASSSCFVQRATLLVALVERHCWLLVVLKFLSTQSLS